ncbi:hypothetical protein BKA62DRAFT_713018 [Auriculariales sp. MPI-PUGE-AT-0066]|nr:hypothetical protein BKA62DRAFT_713018 [Auriculariales sp. MPI-PUGE-AT-0066]
MRNYTHRPPLHFVSVFNPPDNTKMLENLHLARSAAADVGRLYICHCHPDEEQKMMELARIMSLCPSLNWVRLQTTSARLLRMLCDTITGSVDWPLLETLEWHTAGSTVAEDRKLSGDDLSRLLMRAQNIRTLVIDNTELSSDAILPLSLRTLECCRGGISLLTQLLNSRELVQRRITKLTLYGKETSEETLDCLRAALDSSSSFEGTLLQNVRTLSLGKFASAFPLRSPCALQIVSRCIKLRELVLYLEDPPSTRYDEPGLLLAATSPTVRTLVFNVLSAPWSDATREYEEIVSLLDQEVKNGFLRRVRELMIFGVVTGDADEGQHGTTLLLRRLCAARRIQVKLFPIHLWRVSPTCSFRV